MKKEVVHFECDNCGDSTEDKDNERRNPLPDEWAHVVAKTNEGWLFELDLCTKCMEVMRKALLRRHKK